MIKHLRILLFMPLSLAANPVIHDYVTLNNLKNTRTCCIHTITCDEQQEFVAKLNNAKVYEAGTIITRDNKILADTAVLWNKSIDEHPQLGKDLDTQELYFDGTLAIIASSGQQNYYHWMFQMLPRLELIKQSGIPYDKLYFYDLGQPFHYETLDQLNICLDDVIIGNPETLIQARTMLVPSIPVWPSKGKTFGLWVQKFLNKTFLKKESNGQWRKLFISRRNAPSRRILNEKDLITILDKKGFEIVHLEELSVTEQAQLFNEARIIIGSHGAGLTNLVFAQPGTTIIEINSPAENRCPYNHLSQERNLSYILYEPDFGNLTEEQKAQDDVILELSHFEKFIHTYALNI